MITENLSFAHNKIQHNQYCKQHWQEAKRVQGVQQLQATANLWHQEEETKCTNKSVQDKRTNVREAYRPVLSSPIELITILNRTEENMRTNSKVRLHMDRVKRIWYLSHMRAAKVQASLRIRAVSPEPSLLAHTNSESRGTFRQKARSLAPLNGWACAVKICHNGMLEDTNSLDGAHMKH